MNMTTKNLSMPIQEEFEFTKSHEFHLAQIKLATCDLLDKKYKAGVQEYKGTKLWTMPAANLIESSIEETTDQITYLLTLRQTMRIIMQLAFEGMNDESVCATTSRDNCKAIWHTIVGFDR